MPRPGSVLGIKSVGHGAAALIKTVEGKETAAEDEGRRADIAKLTLDWILEVSDGGPYVGGGDAYRLLVEHSPELAARGCLAQLSIDAVRYGERLGLPDVTTLANRLYSYHRKPLAPSANRIDTAFDAYAWLSPPGSKTRTLLDKEWTADWADGSAWLVWTKRRYVRPMHHERAKLYISPHESSIRDMFPIVVEALSNSGAESFKIAPGTAGWLRPDKWVAYFSDSRELKRTARRLHRALNGCNAHGAPFTAELTSDGLLSWAIDPPGSERVGIGQQRTSWRYWTAVRLAASLWTAQKARALSLPAWRFALERLRLDGVDTDSWKPNQDVFGGEVRTC
jgi:hypothetical protein